MATPIHKVKARVDADGALDHKALFLLIHQEGETILLDEARRVLLMAHPRVDVSRFDAMAKDILDLFSGKFPGYRACNTLYHDLAHTLETLLAMVRLCHGAALAGNDLPPRDLLLGAAAALMHDTGYIQKTSDKEGTGAKYTVEHVPLSADFAGWYLKTHGFGEKDAARVRSMILCTDLAMEIADIPFPDSRAELLGKMLASVDLLGQMASRIYLEKLLYLYQEFTEGKTGGFSSERDLLEKTRGFFGYMEERLGGSLGGVYRYMPRHFSAAFGVDVDPYYQYAQKNLEYLVSLLNGGYDHREELKRRGIFADIERREE
ncbi:MAG: hypothetical protein JRI97_08290 [Deltaproteobacteria bacterium]|nr:hypothetical protein [Deltaproteobacteria bacterium]